MNGRDNGRIIVGIISNVIWNGNITNGRGRIAVRGVTIGIIREGSRITVGITAGGKIREGSKSRITTVGRIREGSKSRIKTVGRITTVGRRPQNLIWDNLPLADRW
eukprot:2863165-Prymnesium_polylepis.1